MKTDRELTELAARAMGFEHVIAYDAYPEGGEPMAYARVGTRRYFRPLSDGGDNHELMVRMRIAVLPPASLGDLVVASCPDDGYTSQVFVHYVNDEWAAVRRAVVLAAVAMLERAK